MTKKSFLAHGALVTLLLLAFAGCRLIAPSPTPTSTSPLSELRRNIEATREALQTQGPTATNTPSVSERIRATNEAIHTPTPPATSTPLIAEIDPTDLQGGDCINSTFPDDIDIESVEIVPCDGPWQYRVLNIIVVENLNSYPRGEIFDIMAHENCDRRYNFLLAPSRESWMSGDRHIGCLQESFGLSISDPGKLDRLVFYAYLRSGECFNEAPENLGQQVEVVSCSGDWAYRVTNRIEVSEYDSYPGEDFFAQVASGQCQTPYYYRYPLPETWVSGDRAVLCIEQGS